MPSHYCNTPLPMMTPMSLCSMGSPGLSPITLNSLHHINTKEIPAKASTSPIVNCSNRKYGCSLPPLIGQPCSVLSSDWLDGADPGPCSSV